MNYSEKLFYKRAKITSTDELVLHMSAIYSITEYITNQ